MSQNFEFRRGKGKLMLIILKVEDEFLYIAFDSGFCTLAGSK